MMPSLSSEPTAPRIIRSVPTSSPEGFVIIRTGRLRAASCFLMSKVNATSCT